MWRVIGARIEREEPIGILPSGEVAVVTTIAVDILYEKPVEWFQITGTFEKE